MLDLTLFLHEFSSFAEFSVILIRHSYACIRFEYYSKLLSRGLLIFQLKSDQKVLVSLNVFDKASKLPVQIVVTAHLESEVEKQNLDTSHRSVFLTVGTEIPLKTFESKALKYIWGKNFKLFLASFRLRISTLINFRRRLLFAHRLFLCSNLQNSKKRSM